MRSLSATGFTAVLLYSVAPAAMYCAAVNVVSNDESAAFISVIRFVVVPSLTTILSIIVLVSSCAGDNVTGTFTSVWSVSPRSMVNVQFMPPSIVSTFVTLYFDFLSTYVKLPAVRLEKSVP